MDAADINGLPEELLLRIFQYLELQPPSVFKLRREPTLQLTDSTIAPLKHISRVSKQWRRIVLPRLFRCARIWLDGRLPAAEAACPACCVSVNRTASQPNNYAQLHVDMCNDVFRRDPGLGSRLLERAQPSSSTAFRLGPGSETSEEVIAAWSLKIYHRLQNFLDFLEGQHLLDTVESLVVLTNSTASAAKARFPHESKPIDWRYFGAAVFFHHLLSKVELRRIVIVAPPLKLACLAGAPIDTAHTWAFADMDLNILELRHQDQLTPSDIPPTPPYKYLAPFPRERRFFAPSSVIWARHWTHASLNEGSFLKAYGTYEFFERGPPTILTPLEGLNGPGELRRYPVFPIRSFSYTGIFPFSTHATFRTLLGNLEELDVRFAPDVESGILDDKERIGRAQLQDCWQELTEAHRDLADWLATENGRCLKLKKFVCGDKRIVGIRDDLDDIYVTLRLPRWVEMQPGVYHQLSETGEVLGYDEKVEV